MTESALHRSKLAPCFYRLILLSEPLCLIDRLIIGEAIDVFAVDIYSTHGVSAAVSIILASIYYNICRVSAMYGVFLWCVAVYSVRGV